MPEAHKLSTTSNQVPHFPEIGSLDWFRVKVANVDFFLNPSPFASLDLTTIVSSGTKESPLSFSIELDPTTRTNEFLFLERDFVNRNEWKAGKLPLAANLLFKMR